jgi:hypothetical protein
VSENKDLADSLLSTSSDDIWGERKNDRHDKRVIGDNSYLLKPQEEQRPNYAPVLIILAVILAVIYGVLYSASGIFK